MYLTKDQWLLTGGGSKILPITLKGIARLKRRYVESKNASGDLWDLFSSINNPDSSVKDEVSGATSFPAFVATIQKDELLDMKVKELSLHYCYSLGWDEIREENPVTVGMLKRMLVDFKAGDDWKKLGWQLSNKEAEGVIRLVEFDVKDGDNDLDDAISQKIII